MVALLAAWMWFKPLSLGPVPNREAMIVGEKLARQGKGLDRVLLDDRQVIGRWARTYLPHDSEDVIWVSSDLISRWLGYLKESQGLTDAEVQTRWSELAEAQGKSLWFIIRLAALDKQDPLDMGMEESAQNGDLNPVVISTTLTDIGGNRVALQEVDSCQLGDFRSSDADQVIGLPWFIFSDRFKPLLPAIPPSPPSFDLGSNEGRLLFVQSRIPAELLAARGLEVRVISRKKNLIAHFSTIRFGTSQIQSQDANRDVQRGFGSG